MFFKRESAKAATFSEQVDQLRSAGYGTEPMDGELVLVRRGNLGAVIREGADAQAELVEVGLVVGRELALLTDLGFQKIFLTRGGRKMPALAEHLEALHEFQEDLRERLNLKSLYNEGLGTTNEQHLYDRVKDRNHGVPKRPWEKG